MGDERIGVVLLNLGGPESLADVPAFLVRLLSDPDVVTLPWPIRPAIARIIAWRRSARVADHYRAIGGRSPMTDQTRAQVEALGVGLGDGYALRYAFRHSPPSADQVAAGLAEAGVRRVVALPAYPHWSRSTFGSAVRDLRRAAEACGLMLREVPAYPQADGFITALAAQVEPLLTSGAHLVISAHGLPASIVRNGDPYVEHVRRTVTALVARLPAGTGHSLAFQSRMGPVEWTRPYLADEIRRLAADGVESLVVAPVSFACENLETLYELDHEMAGLARACGIGSFRRAPAPGCHPAFIGELVRLVERTARDAGWENCDGR